MAKTINVYSVQCLLKCFDCGYRPIAAVPVPPRRPYSRTNSIKRF